MAARIAPAIGDLTIADHWSGLRPFALDGLPILGGIGGIDDLFIQFLIRIQQQTIFEAFVTFISWDRRRGDKLQLLMASTVCATLSGIGEAFILHGCWNW